MLAGLLRQDKNAANDEDSEHRRGERTTKGKAAVGQRLVEKIADRGAERPRQDKRRPEQKHPRNSAPEIEAAKELQAPPAKTSAPPA